MDLRELVFKLGARKRNPHLFQMYEELKRTEKLSRAELEEIQLKKLKNLLEIAYNKTSYYRTLFDRNEIQPKDIRTLDDLKKIPFLTKKDIISNLSKIRNYECSNTFYSETSGSTGEPMIFYRNEEWDSAGRAAQMRGYSWYNVSPWEKNGYLWGHIYGSKYELKTRILDFLINRFRMFSYKNKDMDNFIKNLKKAQYLEGYSSMIYEVAKMVNKNNDGPIELKMIKGTSEQIYESYQSEVIKAFGKKMISEYGSGESSLIAFECPLGNKHVVMENVIVEEENREIYVTNLYSYSMPIIRYKLGDSIILNKDKKCPCGMQHEIIEEILGRTGNSIYGKNNKYPSLTLYYIFKSIGVKNNNKTINYQGVQRTKGKLEILIDRTISEEEKKSILKECFNYFEDDVDITILQNGLKRDYTKKFKDFCTYIEE